MNRKYARVLLAVLLFSGLLLGGRAMLADVPLFGDWASYVQIPYYPNGQVGLVAFWGKLIMTWGDQSTNYLNASYSFDGRNWSSPVVLSGFPRVYNTVSPGAPPPISSGGVSMTASYTCGYVYVAYTDPSGDRIYGARSQDGVNWDGGHLIWSLSAPPTGGPATSSPALYGANSGGTIGFAFPVYSSNASQPNGTNWTSTYGYKVSVGQFNCDFSNPHITSSCFMWNSATGTCQDSAATPGYPSLNPNVALEFDEGPPAGHSAAGPWSPLWTGAGGVELRAVAQGNPVGNAEPPIFYSLNQGSLSCAALANCPSSYFNDGAPWANNGVGGAIGPDTGTPFLFITCRQYNTDTCSGSSIWDLNGTPPFINAIDLGNRRVSRSGNWFIIAPSVTYNNGRFWLAGCGNWGCQDGIDVMSVWPAQLTGCTYNIPQQTMYTPGSGGPYGDSVSTTGIGCIWTASSNSIWLTLTGASGNGTGQFTFSADQSPGTPQTGTISVADKKTVTVNQGTVTGTPGTGWVTIYGAPVQQTVNMCPNSYPYNCWVTMWESGSISILVNGQTFTVQFGGPNWTAASLASTLASQINSLPPYSAVSATLSGTTVHINSTINGANTNYSLSTTYTYTSGFSGPAAYSSASGSTLTGGTN
jgi:hypothetical protein